MRSFRQNRSYVRVKPGVRHELEQRTTFYVRAPQPCEVYAYATDDDDDAGYLAGYGSEPFEMELQAGFFEVLSPGPVYLATDAKEQPAYLASDEVFTTLDRPAPMSPEMQAIMRLQKMNERDRERTRAQIERLQDENAELREFQPGGADSVVLEEAPEEEHQENTEDLRGSKKDAPKQKRSKSKKLPDTAQEPPGGAEDSSATPPQESV